MKITNKNIIKKLGTFKSVYNYENKPNQFLINFENGQVLQSYDSIIVIKLDGKVYLGNDWNYSRTTGKYRNLFLYETTKETEQKIKNGDYTLLNI